MVRSIIERYFDIYHRISGDNTIIQRLFNAHFNRPDVFFRYHTTDNGIDEFKTFAALIGGDLNPHVTILTMTTRLTNVLTLSLRLTRNRLAIGDLWPSDVCLDLELAEHTVHQHLQMELPHAADDGLTTLGVGMHPEGGILFRQFVEGDRHLVLVGTCSRLDSNVDHRLREGDRFQYNRVLRITEGVTCAGVTQAYRGTDIPSSNLVDILAVIGMHTQQAPNAL